MLSRSISHAAAIAAGALSLTWPALYNGYPLLYPDSMTYLDDGHLVARALFQHKFAPYYGMRSLLYSLGIFPFHWNVTPWPIVFLHAFLTAYVIWLVVRSISPPHSDDRAQHNFDRGLIARYLLLVALLSLLTSLSWFTCAIMPDILGPVLYLCIYLLVFAPDALSRAERLAVAFVAWFGAVSHMTHLMLGAGLCVLFVLLSIVWRSQMRGRPKSVALVAFIVLLAAGAQVGLNAYLYGEPSLTADSPPYLLARILADGPGRWYLQQHCAESSPPRFTLCDSVQNLTDDSDEFLWGEKGVWANASEESLDRMRAEEVPLILATLRAYPRAELSIAASNFWRQLTAFGIFAFDANNWMLEVFDATLPGQRPRYLKSLQAHNALPLDFFSDVLTWTVLASIALIAILVPLLWRRLFPRLTGLGTTLVAAVVANAFVTGVFSTVEDRYECRVVWLVPFLAGTLVLAWLDRRSPRTNSALVL